MTKRKKILFSLSAFFLVAAGIGGYFGFINFFNNPSTSNASGLNLVIKPKTNDQSAKQLTKSEIEKEVEFAKFSKYAEQISQENEDLEFELGQKESFFSRLSNLDLEKIKENNVVFPDNYENFNFDTNNNFVTKENNEKFLGSQNDNLLVYDLNYPKINQLIKENESFKSDILNQKFTIFDSKARNQIFKLDKIGVYSESLGSKKYDSIYQRNVKFKSGTAAILDANSEKALLITNHHVIKPIEYKYNDENFEIDSKSLRFWNTLGGNFLEWYENGKTYSLDRDNTALLFYVKQVFENKTREFDHAKILEYLMDFYNDYFEVPSDFNNQNFDVGLFYFKYKKFNDDLKKLAKFYHDNKSEILEKIRENDKINNHKNTSKISIEAKFNEFLNSYQGFVNYWEKITKEKPVKISPKVWKKGDSSYDLNISLFWPKAKPMKNNFKGVYATDPQENFSRLSLYFYTNNGPGASGSGIFNKDGELQFINAFGLINNFYDNNSKVEKNYYDKLNTNISLSGGIPLVTEEYNLADSIRKFYPSNQKSGFSIITNKKVRVKTITKNSK
ncbi:Uncharacterised protein [Mesomycoplasma dispar]|uniref:Uncharacterized protein n=1 Tax=Mesomycoplasma dispar TaxID=86660 RepID=A0AAJ5TCQ0_9BACT|nr:hypothetical protein [Mesomycoplasma dispar]AJR12220.1 hypothetical protein MDIS_02145 [Mesomycoplasma dispar]VEU61828.1 Uncharacterised protein [Mesomycoplasma dispar]